MTNPNYQNCQLSELSELSQQEYRKIGSSGNTLQMDWCISHTTKERRYRKDRTCDRCLWQIEKQDNEIEQKELQMHLLVIA